MENVESFDLFFQEKSEQKSAARKLEFPHLS